MKIDFDDTKSASELVDEYFNHVDKAILNKCTYIGYKQIIELTKDQNTFLSELLKLDYLRNRNVKPELKNLAVEFMIIKACKQGALSFTPKYVENYKQTGSNLRLFSSDDRAILTINQVSDTNVSSRNARFRTNLRYKYNNQLSLFDTNSSIADTSMLKLYFELTHGYQSEEPQFVVLGIPDSKGKWVTKENISSVFERYTDIEREEISTVTNEISKFNKDDFGLFIENKQKS
ncbi:hypothetical protein [Lactobacillus sp. ESL0703]|uniref:hypothetical protein n=1 Tax=Lactobacillus sp. ESL0703 TaxID=2983218 RepID=UPI0023F96436|nr:hypothetical protein [Lactobacillus sp. ESL0703]MDF7668543.1 hypothetical protein [Lactobacillus sp. ESL0703]